MKALLIRTARTTAMAYTVFFLYRLSTLALERPWGPDVYGFVVGGLVGDLALTSALTSAYLGAKAAAAGMEPRSFLASVALVGAAVMVADGVLHPIWQDLVRGFLLSPAPLSPDLGWPWSIWRILRAGAEVAGDLALLDWIYPIWLGSVALILGMTGYLMVSTGGPVSATMQVSLLTLISGGGFLAMVKVATWLARGEHAPIWVAFALPLLLPASVLAAHLVTRARAPDDR